MRNHRRVFCGSVDELSSVGLPPMTPSISIAPGFFAGGNAIDLTALRVFALAAHQHWTGQQAIIAKSSGAADPGRVLYENRRGSAAARDRALRRSLARRRDVLPLGAVRAGRRPPHRRIRLLAVAAHSAPRNATRSSLSPPLNPI
jgi:hypothetical protein